MGDRRIWALLAATVLLLAACSDSTPDPTLAPGTSAPLTSPPTTATTVPPTTEAPTTTAAPTTTDPNLRFQEIERLVREALVGRMEAIHDKDLDQALLFAGSQRIYDSTLEAMERTVFLQRPSVENYFVAVSELRLDRPDCVVADVTTTADGVIEGVAGPGTTVMVFWPSQAGQVQLGAVWELSTPQSQWIEECDIAVRGVTP